MDEVTTFPTLRAKRQPIKARLAGDDLEDISIPSLILATCEDALDFSITKLITAFGAEFTEERVQVVYDRVVERMCNANNAR